VYNFREIFKKNRLLKTIIATIAVVWTLNLRTCNFMSVILVVLFWLLFERETNLVSKKDRILSELLGLVLAVFLVLGSYDQFETALNLKSILLVKYIVAIVGWQCIFQTIIGLIFKVEDSMNFLPANEDTRWGKKVFGATYLICILCWIPGFLMYYPGILTWDTEWQLEQATGISSLSNHQPIVHTMFLKGLYKIGYTLFETENGGMAICVIVQMLLMAAVFSWMVFELYKYGVNKKYLVGCIAFFAFVPINALYSITIWKDVLFAGIVLAFTIMLWRLNESEQKQIKNYVVYLIGFTGISILVCLMRSNGFYAYILCIPFMMFTLKKQRKYILLTIVITLGSVSLIKGPVMQAQEIVQPDTVENLSIPIQHIARVIADGNDLTEKEMSLLNKVIEVEKIPGEYSEYISDPIKTLIREKDNQDYIVSHKKDYFLLWMQLGIRYPGEYVKAQIDQTRGYWTPDVQYWVTTTEMTEHADVLNIYRTSLLPGFVTQIAGWIENAYIEIPLLGMLWSIGFYLWITLLALVLRKRQQKSVLPFIPVLAIWTTLIVATPVYAEFRYIYSMVVCVPLFIGIVLQHMTKEVVTDE